MGDGLFAVEELAAHGVARAGDVALGEHDLEKMRAARGRAEHLGAAVQVNEPDAPETLIEALRVQRLDALPVALEPLRPGIERERIVAPQVLDIDDFESRALHFD